jgi:hypothetical protein
MNDEPGSTRKIDWVDFVELKKDMTDMKTLMARMVDTLSRIAVIEDRQQAMSQSTEMVLKRLEAIAEKQHQYELGNVTSHNIVGRGDRNESDIKALTEKQSQAQASFKTAIWLGRAAWVGIASIGGLLWVVQSLITSPIPK